MLRQKEFDDALTVISRAKYQDVIKQWPERVLNCWGQVSNGGLRSEQAGAGKSALRATTEA